MELPIKDKTPREVQDFLETHAGKVEEGEYFRPFTDEDLADAQSEFARGCVKLDAKDNELSKIKSTYKGEMDALKKENKKLLHNISSKGEMLTGKQYLFDDQENGMMHYYDSNGQLVYSRRLKPDERQLNVLSLSRTANG